MLLIIITIFFLSCPTISEVFPKILILLFSIFHDQNSYPNVLNFTETWFQDINVEDIPIYKSCLVEFHSVFKMIYPLVYLMICVY